MTTLHLRKSIGRSPGKKSSFHSRPMKGSLNILALILSASFCLQASASTITVQDTGDGAANAANCPGSGCRLRDALAKASGDATIDTIDFSVTTPATITLTSSQLEVNANVTISGPGANLLTVDANHNSRVFYIDSGKTVTISGLTITNGSFNGNGGGIYNDHATLTVTNSTLSGNSATNLVGGGGIYNDGTNSGSAMLTISNSTLSGNSAPFGGGGGIANNGLLGSATLTITNSTLSGNSAGQGGGIQNRGTLTVTNSTLSGNSAGGISTSAGTLTIGGTILKAGASGVNLFHNLGTVTSLGYNLSSDDASLLLNQSTDQNSTDPKLGPLQDNGGPTFTHALCTASGVPDASCTGVSPAIDQGKDFTSATTDQRGSGFARTVDFASIPNAIGGDGTDIGAFEVQASAPACQTSTSIKANFNGTPIGAGRYIWFNGVLKAHGLGATPVTITFTNQTITSANFGPLPVPDASVTFDPGAVTATTNFVGGMWVTTVPSGIKGNTFLSGLSFPVPANLPGGIKNVTWNGTISVDTPGVSVNWQWGAAVYTNFSADYNLVGVKPVDDKTASQYQNKDHAGTPENFKPYVIGGATGGGGNNYTGGLSGTASVCR
jgi:hypothetical protein